MKESTLVAIVVPAAKSVIVIVELPVVPLKALQVIAPAPLIAVVQPESDLLNPKVVAAVPLAA